MLAIKANSLGSAGRTVSDSHISRSVLHDGDMMVRPRKDISLETTPLQNQIYALLINPNFPRRPRSQMEVCNLLDLAKSTVNDNVRKLVDKGFIAEKERIGKEIYYRPGMYKKLIEKRISIDNIAYGAQFDTYGRAITVPTYAELRDERAAQPYRPIIRTHLNGGWLMFTVIREGNLDYLPADPRGESKDKGGNQVRYPLFGEAMSWNMRGSLNWNAVLDFDGSMLDIRYQRTSKGRKYFYIVPENKICTAADTTPDEDIVTPFMDSVRPVLDWMEEYGDWRFMRNDRDEYAATANIKKGKRGLRKEYGMDEFITQLISEVVGGDYGVPGETPGWIDRSDDSLGPDGELETDRQDYVEAVDALPITKRKADAAADRCETLRLIGDLRADLNAVIRVILEHADVILQPEYKMAKKDEVEA